MYMQRRNTKHEWEATDDVMNSEGGGGRAAIAAVRKRLEAEAAAYVVEKELAKADGDGAEPRAPHKHRAVPAKRVPEIARKQT